MNRILIVDDETNMGLVLKMLLEDEGYGVVTRADGREAIRLLESGEVIDLILSDLKMPHVDGLGILEHIKKTSREIPLVMITAYGTIPDAVEAMKKGAADFITKPFNSEIILHTVRRIFHMKKLEADNRILSDSVREDRIVYQSPAMGRIMEMVRKIAPARTPVLIIGESGTGKELIAKAIHKEGMKAGEGGDKRPFVRINCPAIPETLFESELFGYQRGAFTGAAKDYRGKVRLAERGSLFLDEVGELPPGIQPKLLRLLEDRTFEPLGSNTTIQIDTRFICATNRDLSALVKRGEFREDLYYRINTLTIHLPALQERREDIPLLLDYYLEKYCLEMGKNVRVSEEARRAFLQYDWPGNIRELKNVVERMIVLAGDGARILPKELPREILGAVGTGLPPVNRLQEHERGLVLEALGKTGWNITTAAAMLGTSRSNLRYRIRKYGLAKGDYSPSGGG